MPPYKRKLVVADGFVPSKRRQYMGIALASSGGGLRNRYPRRRGGVKGGIAPKAELKFIDLAVANYPCNTTGSVTLVNGVAVGDDYNTRDGRQITVKSVQVHGSISAGQSLGSAMARCMLVWDNAPNGVLATVAEIWDGTPNGTNFPLVGNQERFTILWDSVNQIGPNFDTATQAKADQVIKPLEFYKRLNTVAQFIGTTNGIASIGKGALLWVCGGNLVDGTTDPVATVTIRTRFSDF